VERQDNHSPEDIPPNLDYDFWLGPAPFKPYSRIASMAASAVIGLRWRRLADMAQHFLDPAQYYLARTTPARSKSKPEAPFPAHPDACGLWGKVSLKYADGTTLILESGEWGDVSPDLAENYRQGEHAQHVITGPAANPC